MDKIALNKMGVPMLYNRINSEETKLTVTCPFCKKEQSPFIVKSQDYYDWIQGKLIQKAFPYLSPS